jgi:hypothetical protein
MFPIRQVWRHDGTRLFIASTGLVLLLLCLQYFAYLVFDDWSYLRFFLPAWPFMMIGSVAGLWAVGRFVGRAGVIAAALTCVVAGAWTARETMVREVPGIVAAERKYPQVGEIVRHVAPPGSVVIAHQHSGSVRYYAGLVTVNMLNLDEHWLDKGVAWLVERGVGTYVVLEDWEVPLFRERFEPSNRLGTLPMPPTAVFMGAPQIFVYDLSRGVDGAGTMRWPDRQDLNACSEPAPASDLSLRSAGASTARNR